MEWKVAPSYQTWTLKKVDEDSHKGYVVTDCDKCGGTGLYAWFGMCFKCEGTGKIGKWVKIYTPEQYEKYIAAQEKAREKRVEKAKAREQALLDNSEENKAIILEKWGFDPADPAVYLVAGGNTFEIKDELKERGGRFNPALNWHFTKEVEVPEGFELVKVPFDEVYDWYPMVKRIDIKQNAKEIADAARATILTDSKSDFVGTVKERMRDLKVVLTGRREFDKGYYGTTTMLTFALGDNVLVWFASSYIPEEKTIVGHDYLLTGTVKEHKVYDGVKQTYLNRCILKELAN